MSNTQTVFSWLPCSVVFISTIHGDKRDIMTATAMFVSEKEPLLAISVAKDHLTAQLIQQSGGFTLAIASEKQKDLVWKLGSVKGSEQDKFKHFSISTLPPKPHKPLIPEYSAAWFECRVESSTELNNYQLIIARVTAQDDTGRQPLVWHKQSLFSLKA